MKRKCNPMKPICVTVLPVVLLLGLTVTYCLAADPAADEKFKNGIPFATLAAEISANTTAIDALEVETTNLTTSLQALTADVAGLTTRVTANESAIATIQNTLSGLSTQVANNFSELQQQAEALSALQQDVVTNADAIAVTQANIDALEITLTQQLTAMDANITSLSGQLDTLVAECNTLKTQCEAQYAATQAQIGTLLTEINALKAADANTLVEQATQNANIISALTQIVMLQQSLSEAKDDFDSLADEVGSLNYHMFNYYGMVQYYHRQFVNHYHYSLESVTWWVEHWWGTEWFRQNQWWTTEGPIF
jgi:chromosome segregation ATPase